MHVVVGTAGHIDHGKTTLVRALTGVDCDRLPEEKARGITIDLGFARGDWNGTRFAFVDVPGHERFVRNMLAGATGIDVALLVVAADESVRPQTREHLDILDLLAIPRGVVALTKSDRAEPGMRELAREEIGELLRGTSLEGSPIVEVSAVTGEGLDALRGALSDAAARGGGASGREALPPRLPIDRVFSVKGFGTVVTGTLVSGAVSVGDRLLRLPDEREVRVRGVEVHGETRERAVAGERTSLNLAGLEVPDLSRGDVLAAPGSLALTRMPALDLRLLPSARPLAHGDRVRFHLGSAELVGRIHLPAGGELPPGNRAVAQIGLEGELPCRRGDRFVLRSLSPVATIGGGVVLDPLLGRLRERDVDETLAAILRAADPAPRLALAVRRPGFRGVRIPELPPRLALDEVEIETLASSLPILRLGTRFLDDSLRPRLEEEGRALLAELAATDRTATAMPLRELSQRLLRRIPEECRDPLLRLWAEKKTFPIERDRVVLPGRKDGLGGPESESARRILDLYRKAGLAEAPSPGAVSRELSIKPQIVEGLVRHLASRGELVRLPGDWVVSREAVDDVVRRLRESGRATIDVGGFKEMFGLTRKLAIPLLEWLDGSKVTLRTGDTRKILPGSAR